MTQERIKLRAVHFPAPMHVHGRPYNQLPGVQTGRSHLQNIELAFLPEMEVIEVICSNKPKLWIARDQVFSMEPEQDMPAVATAGPVAHSDVPEPAPVAPEPVKVPEGARDSLSAPLPDLRPPPKNRVPTLLSNGPSKDVKMEQDKPTLSDKLDGKLKKRGRPKKVKE